MPASLSAGSHQPLSIDMVGIEDASRLIARWGKRAPSAFAGAVYLFAGEVLTDAMRLVPVDSGFLRESRYLTKPSVSLENGVPNLRLELGFSASYAAAVHERWARHPTGTWKFLDIAVALRAGTAERTIASSTKRLMAANQGIDSITLPHPQYPHSPLLRRRKHTAAIIAKRARAHRSNMLAGAVESAKSLAAQRLGHRPVRPRRSSTGLP